MAAIIPHLEEQSDESETPAEREWFASLDDRVIRTSGLGHMLGRTITADERAELRGRAMQVSHAELLRTTGIAKRTKWKTPRIPAAAPWHRMAPKAVVRAGSIPST